MYLIRTLYQRTDQLSLLCIFLDVPKKKISYCRCWKSSTFPLCDGVHKSHNQECGDSTGPLVLIWNDPETDVLNSSMDASLIDADIDIKSIDSDSPFLKSSNDSNGEYEPMDKLNEPLDEQLSSLEMVEDRFARPEEKGNKEDDDTDEDTVKVDH